MKILLGLLLLTAIICACFGAWLPAIFFLVLWKVVAVLWERHQAAKIAALHMLGYFDPIPVDKEDERRMRLLEMMGNRTKNQAQ
jgi:hypothetical protein